MIRSLLLTVCFLNFVKPETKFPPFYAVKMKEDTDKFTIFEQDSCDTKLYQSRENTKTFLYPKSDDPSKEWVISTNLTVTTFPHNEMCKEIRFERDVLLRLEVSDNGTLLPKAGSPAKIMKLEDCKTYPKLTFSAPTSDLKGEAKDLAKILSYFGVNGELNKKKEKKENFFMSYVLAANVYRFYDSKRIVYLTRLDNDDNTKFMVFKADCLTVEIKNRNSFGDTLPRFLFPDNEYEYLDEYFDKDLDDVDDDYNDDDDIRKATKDVSKKENIYLIIGVSSAIILIILFVIAVVCVMKRKEIGCFQGGKNNRFDGELKVHQNDLYGNLSNQEEWQERYDTNITDKNTYYEDYYSGDQYGQNEENKDKAHTKDSTKEEKDQESTA